MSTSDGRDDGAGMSRELALRIEFTIIGIGILALLMIFQPFSLSVFAIGCVLVVVAALANNLLPLAEPGKPLRGVIFAALVVALIFCSAVLLAIVSAWLYGQVFLTAPATPSLVAPRPPFWMHPMVWTLAGLAVLLALAIRFVTRKD